MEEVVESTSRLDETSKLELARQEWEQKGKDTHVLIKWETDKGGRMFKIVTFAELLQLMHPASFIPHRNHEAMHYDRPCKLHVDVEFHYTTFEEGERRRVWLQEEIYRRLQHALGLQKEPECIILDSSSPIKYSVHLIYPDVWFEAPVHIKELLDGLYLLKPYKKKSWEEKEPEEAKHVVDKHYSTTKSNLWMRFPYNHKREFKIPLLPRGIKSFSPEVFGRCCISLYSDESPWSTYFPRPKYVYSIPLKIYGSVGNSIQNTELVSIHNSVYEGSEDSYQRIHQGANRVIDYLIRTKGESPGEIRPSGFQIHADGSYRVHLHPGLHCVRKNGTHDSIFMGVGSHDNRHVWSWCMDDMCKFRAYFPEDFLYVAYPPKKLPSIELLQEIQAYKNNPA
jgi:hypothetical protein